MLMADYGVNLYGNTIIVNPKFAAEKPDAVKGFLRAFLKGLKDTVRNPSQPRSTRCSSATTSPRSRSNSNACSMAINATTS